MKCPKCQYIGFDDADRCRNCGYDFSMFEHEAPLDLAIQDGSEAIGPLADLALKTVDAPPPVAQTPDPASQRPITSSFDLPLFKDRHRADDAPLVAPGPTRPPLAVRRPAPVTPRPRPRREPVAPEPRLALDTSEFPIAAEERPDHLLEEPRHTTAAQPITGAISAPLGARLLAGIVDLALMGGIDAAVVYFTLKICDLAFAEWRALPLAPLLGFLAILNGGYLACFIAAGGQTIGKMATAIRVVPGDPAATAEERVPLGTAIVRAAAYALSVLPAGIGLVPALLGTDRRALHDRLADTRVVKA
jgi:uncharacterized RDD family membrane protein YckC